MLLRIKGHVLIEKEREVVHAARKAIKHSYYLIPLISCLTTKLFGWHPTLHHGCHI